MGDKISGDVTFNFNNDDKFMILMWMLKFMIMIIINYNCADVISMVNLVNYIMVAIKKSYNGVLVRRFLW